MSESFLERPLGVPAIFRCRVEQERHVQSRGELHREDVQVCGGHAHLLQQHPEVPLGHHGGRAEGDRRAPVQGRPRDLAVLHEEPQARGPERDESIQRLGAGPGGFGSL